MSKLTTILLCVILFFIAMNYVQYDTIKRLKDQADQSDLVRERDSLQHVIDASQVRYDLLEAQDDAYQQRISELEGALAAREHQHQPTQNAYGKQIKDVEKYTPTSIDSFYLDMYPHPGVRKYRYNPDGTRKLSNLENKDDDPDGNPIRLIDE